VDDVSEGFLDAERKPALYTPERDAFFVGMVVRTATDPASLANAVQSAMAGAEPNVTVFGVTTMDERVANAAPMFLRRLPAVLVTAFGSLALLLAAIGIYGVISYSVAQRTREFGVRMALGASASNLLQLVLGGALRMTLAGLAAGIVSAALLARLASGMLFGIRASDFLSFAAVPLVVAGIAALASYLPARRAAGLDPMEALRYE
jgi:putative ABC transport system permease protein